MHFVSIASIFKNEKHIFKEWIETHIREGIDHFYLIDNGSTDNPLEVLQEYIDKGVVTYIHDTQQHVQQLLYNRHFLPRRLESTWWVIIDLDEFVYAPTGTVADFLKTVDVNVGSILMPWVNFSSNGHISQPRSVVKSFTIHEDLDTRKDWGINCKSIIKGTAMTQLGVHHSRIAPNFQYMDSNRQPSDYVCALFVSNDYHDTCGVRLNHYCVQSWEWFSSVKMTRGDACTHHNGRDRAFFDAIEARCSKTYDDALYKKHQDLYDNI